MHFYENERVAIFIDGANNHSAAKALHFEIDYKRLLALFRRKSHLVTARYYTSVAEFDDYSSIRPLVDWLEYNGFHLVTKPAREIVDRTGTHLVKGNLEIEIVIDCLQLAGSIDHIVLFSGDGRFTCLVAALQDMGKRVTVVSSMAFKPPIAASELRRQADQFVELADLAPEIDREPKRNPVNANDAAPIQRKSRPLQRSREDLPVCGDG